jgi:hypothetical protein
MTTLTLIFSVFVIWIGVWSYFASPTRGAWALVLVVMYLGLYIGWSTIMGWAKPVPPMSGERAVISYHFKEGEAIYLWVLEDEPRAYSLPWDIEQARKIRKAGRDAKGQGVKLMWRRGVPEGEYAFHPAPVPELPPK